MVVFVLIPLLSLLLAQHKVRFTNRKPTCVNWRFGTLFLVICCLEVTITIQWNLKQDNIVKLAFFGHRDVIYNREDGIATRIAY